MQMYLSVFQWESYFFYIVWSEIDTLTDRVVRIWIFFMLQNAEHVVKSGKSTRFPSLLTTSSDFSKREETLLNVNRSY